MLITAIDTPKYHKPISPLKSAITKFRKRKSKVTIPPPSWKQPILVAETIKVFGLRFNDRHSWLPHIKETKAKWRAINVSEYLPHPLSLWMHRKVLPPLYQSPVCSILDYGAPIYGLAPPSQLALLDTIQNAGLAQQTTLLTSSQTLIFPLKLKIFISRTTQLIFLNLTDISGCFDTLGTRL